MKRVALDQTIGAPIAIGATLSLVMVLQGRAEDVPARLSQSLLQTYSSGLMFWPAVNFFSFRYIAVAHQPLYANFASLGWNCFLSLQANKALVESGAGAVLPSSALQLVDVSRDHGGEGTVAVAGAAAEPAGARDSCTNAALQ